jgi:hypothetical protein
VSPGSALASVFAAALTATCDVLGTGAGDVEGDEWVPHMTLCYSTTEQPAGPW